MFLNGHTRILVTGRSRSGSWHVRGEQLGSAIGGVPQLNASKVKEYDLAILVKRQRPDLLHRLHTAHVPIVWDVVDSWPQPEGNSWGRETCMQWLREEVAIVKPVAIVAATEQMAADCAEFGVPVTTVPHHSRPNQPINPLRQDVQAVGYEGGEQYLSGRWRTALERECAERGWRFVINPTKLADVDIAVAFRGQHGYAVRNWKSNVKLANAQGSGTPCIMNRERGYVETSTRGGVEWVDDPDDLAVAFYKLTNVAARRSAAAKLIGSSIALSDVAVRYRLWLNQLKF